MKKFKAFSTFRPDYLPSLEYFWYMTQCDKIVLTDHFLYSKRSPVALSAPLAEKSNRLRIPVKHDMDQRPIFQKIVDDQSNWQKKHWKTIYHTFHNYPFAYYYLPLLEKMFSQPENRLNILNKNMIQQIAAWLNFPSDMMGVSDFFPKKDNNELVVYFSEKFHAETYLIFHHYLTNNWIDASYLKARQINYDYFKPFPDYHLLVSYRHHSVLKFIMQFGPEAGYLIKQYMDNRTGKTPYVS